MCYNVGAVGERLKIRSVFKEKFQSLFFFPVLVRSRKKKSTVCAAGECEISSFTAQVDLVCQCGFIIKFLHAGYGKYTKTNFFFSSVC